MIRWFDLAIISKKITATVGRTNAKYSLIKDKDSVLLGLSGGKDSLSLAHILSRMQKIAPFKFKFHSVTIDYGMGEDLSTLQKYCKDEGISHEVIKTDIYELSKEKIRQNSSFCSFFSRLRRGHLYTYALKNGYNKLALGHHLDDAVESFFMNFMYNGSLRTLPPIYKAKNGLEVIRPMIYIRERQLIDAALNNKMPTIGDEACPAMRFDVKMPHARANVKKLLHDLEIDNKELFISLKSAFENIHSDSFFKKREV